MIRRPIVCLFVSAAWLSLGCHTADAQAPKPQVIQGKLTTDCQFDRKLKKSYCQIHSVELKRGQVYLFDLKSKQFDTLLRRKHSKGKQLAENDDINTKR